MKTPKFETLAIHAGQTPDPGHGAVMEPIVLATTFAQPEPGKPLRFDYSRSGNPTRAALEACEHAPKLARPHVRAAGAGQAAALRLFAQRQSHPRGARGLPRRPRRRR